MAMNKIYIHHFKAWGIISRFCNFWLIIQIGFLLVFSLVDRWRSEHYTNFLIYRRWVFFRRFVQFLPLLLHQSTEIAWAPLSRLPRDLNFFCFPETVCTELKTNQFVPKQNWIVPGPNLHTNKRHICISVITGIDIKCSKIVNLGSLFIRNAPIDRVPSNERVGGCELFPPPNPGRVVIFPRQTSPSLPAPLRTRLAILFLIKKMKWMWKGNSFGDARDATENPVIRIMERVKKRTHVWKRAMRVSRRSSRPYPRGGGEKRVKVSWPPCVGGKMRASQ